jgi:hypothetical protein
MLILLLQQIQHSGKIQHLQESIPYLEETFRAIKMMA